MAENDISKRIKDLRAKHNLTLQQVADQVGVGKSTIRKWETGMIANMRRDKIAKLAEALHTTPAYLMGWPEQQKLSVNETSPVLQDISDILSDDEEKLLEMYRQLNPQGKEYILQTLVMATQVYTKNASAPNLESSAG